MIKYWFSWDIHLACNYRCEYCFHAGEWKSLADGNIYLDHGSIINSWKWISENYGTPYIDISGGEPTTYPGFFEILEGISAFSVVNICTNLSFDPGMMEGIKKRRNIRIFASFHPQFPEVSDFAGKLLQLQHNGFQVAAAIVDIDQNHALYERLKVMLREKNIPLSLLEYSTPPRKTDKKNYMKSEFREVYKANSHKSDTKSREFQPRLCLAGNRYFRIASNGEIMRCATIDQVFGNLYEGVFEPAKKPILCTSKDCICTSERFFLASNRLNIFKYNLRLSFPLLAKIASIIFFR